jgi:hypothetical protein
MNRNPHTRWRRLRTSTAALGAALVAALLIVSPEPTHAEIPVKELGAVEAVKEAEVRLGATDRMFLIEDKWEFDRCKLLLPKLTTIDLKAESLLVVMSWKYSARTLKGIRSDGDTLVISVDQAKPPGTIADSYHPPKFLVFKVPVWSGPVRYVVNEQPIFTVPRGEALIRQSAETWEEILRIHSGSRASVKQIVRYYKLRSPETPEDDIKHQLLTDKRKIQSFDSAAIYQLLFHDLIDMRARSTTPRVFELIESMGPFDKAFEPAVKSVVGIGGPDVLEQCKKALKSWNPRSRHAAILVLRDLGLPESRPIAGELLSDLQQEAVARCALDLLYKIGITKDDVPAMVRALEKIQNYYSTPVSDRPKTGTYGGDVATSIIIALGSLGPDASASLPVLERFANDFPLPAFQADAKGAIDKIKSGSAHEK